MSEKNVWCNNNNNNRRKKNLKKDYPKLKKENNTEICQKYLIKKVGKN